MRAVQTRALFSEGAETLALRAVPAGSAELRPVDDFDAVAAGLGYSSHATQLMRDGATTLALSIREATAWLDAGITPWAARVWLGQGFADADEAREYRRWGFLPRDAYWARRDGLTATSLRRHRHFLQALAGSRE